MPLVIPAEVNAITLGETIPVSTFDRWKKFYLDRKSEHHKPESVDTSSDQIIVYFSSDTLKLFIESKPQPKYLVFCFGTDDSTRKFGNLTIFMCGMNHPCEIPNPADIFVGSIAPSTELNPKVILKEFRKRQSNFFARNLVVSEFLTNYNPLNEYAGYAHEMEFLEGVGVFSEEFLAVHLGVDNRSGKNNRLTVILEARSGAIPLDSNFLEGTRGVDHGSQCCPIP